MGAGEVTIRHRGHEEKFETGTSFSLDRLRSRAAVQAERPLPSLRPDSTERVVSQAAETLQQQVAKAEDVLAGATEDYSDLAVVASAFYNLASALDLAREAGVEESLVSQARDRFGHLLIAWTGHLAPSPTDTVARLAPFVDLLVDLRSQARAARNWALADEIRNRLSDLGIILEDGPSETTWRRA